MTNYVVAADCGTTGSKAVVFDLKGTPIASGYREYGLEFPNPGWVDQNSQMLFETSVKVIGEAVGKSGVAPSDIIALSLSTQRCTLVPVDVDGNALRAAFRGRITALTPNATLSGSGSGGMRFMMPLDCRLQMSGPCPRSCGCAKTSRNCSRAPISSSMFRPI